ncbi:hypothetical protein IWW36_001072 [Coemansia brasiliensis]|uniref:MINDY deubiquitinase domain-containing protein n=1 Tax=Coemansia brasiliensis TaxID=2650707 RepID=A0A9W8I9S0_9FUNG|nr:hypothetical protein IWW36_001072 [Coemansia brasiliensis]
MERRSSSDDPVGSIQPTKQADDHPSISDVQSKPGQGRRQAEKPNDEQLEDAGLASTTEALAHTDDTPISADPGSSELAECIDKLEVQDRGEALGEEVSKPSDDKARVEEISKYSGISALTESSSKPGASVSAENSNLLSEDTSGHSNGRFIEEDTSESSSNKAHNEDTPEPRNYTVLAEDAQEPNDTKARAAYIEEREAAATEPLLSSDDRPPPLPQRSFTDTRARQQAAAPTQYKLKDIQWQDIRTQRLREVKIVTQNENGPCPLIALINVLLLGNVVQLEGSRKSISEEEMTQMLANTLLQHDVGSPAVAEADVAAILSLLPTLGKGLDVDLQFAHIYDFAESPPLQLFRAFGVDLVHGWVVDVDREPQVADVLLHECRNSYEGAVEFVLAADEASCGQVMGGLRDGESVDEEQVARARRLNAWLQETATQLTDCGLHMLGTMLPDHRLCVLFRNNHFSALYKRGPGELFALCTDEAVAGDPRIVWESLRDVHQATSQFFDSQFNLLKLDGRGKARENDYAQQPQGQQAGDHEHSAQIDEDYALALRLHEEEQRRRTRTDASQQLQVRQQDRMPPGMDVREHGHLYGVPQVSREGEARLAKAMYRSASDENFERRMESTFMPNKAAAKNSSTYRQDQNADRDRCIIC